MRIDDFSPHGLLEVGGAKLGRVYQQMQDTPFFVVSAFRSERSHRENLHATDRLIDAVRQHDLGLTQMEGHWVERLADGGQRRVVEISFFVPLVKHRMSVEAFREFGLSLGRSFDQEAILFGDQHKIAVLTCDDSSEPFVIGSTRQINLSKLGDMFSKIKNRPFGLGAPDDGGGDADMQESRFVFEGLRVR